MDDERHDRFMGKLFWFVVLLLCFVPAKCQVPDYCHPTVNIWHCGLPDERHPRPREEIATMDARYGGWITDTHGQYLTTTLLPESQHQTEVIIYTGAYKAKSGNDDALRALGPMVELGSMSMGLGCLPKQKYVYHLQAWRQIVDITLTCQADRSLGPVAVKVSRDKRTYRRYTGGNTWVQVK